MILAAGLLVLLGLGLFVAGVLTGVTALYWGCVAVCVVAAVLLFVARKRLAAPTAADARTTAATARTEKPVSTADERPGSTPEQAPGAPAEPAAAGTATPAEGVTQAAAGATAASVAQAPGVAGELPDPPVEEVEVTDLLIVVDLKDEVLVIDEHPRYHLPGCVHLGGHTPIPLPLDEARTDGFTPCAACAPDRNLAQRARDRRVAG
ncbi:hypothetical protein [Blastococcus haudaquaticus]|uniref:Uncharacterized protein n=1 Tax=Blastococcus haudaquaticus TaxID=1938745 RepID=A0A286H4S9_9ACTN|nr:hypothetical protein [Blastococcus haudaquaticus]SOE02767.1 hypothetical protein SAMN06272739_3726 [Blastococcus haudaquaticus]